MDEGEKELIQITHDTVIELRTILLGVPNTDDTGLVGEIKQLKVDVGRLYSRQQRLSKNYWMLVGILIGLGVLGTGIYNIVWWLNGKGG